MKKDNDNISLADILKCFFAAILLIVMLMMFGCNVSKKAITTKEKIDSTASSNTTIQQVFTTIYTDTGSITTYYKDSFIVVNDTAIQYIDKIVVKKGINSLIRDSFYFTKHDTVTLAKTIKIKEASKEKKQSSWALNYWFLVLLVVIIWSNRDLIIGKLSK